MSSTLKLLSVSPIGHFQLFYGNCRRLNFVYIAATSQLMARYDCAVPVCRLLLVDSGCHRLPSHPQAPKSTDLPKKTSAAAKEPDSPPVIGKRMLLTGNKRKNLAL